ncbi:MAG TPA: Wzz/FepE/Etk N-terminal domain-containing protein, partial [Bacillota bacterium]|nr:Wzz/FepE/Etk N-terminal domain-containing protein [Bacillota bacterium]
MEEMELDLRDILNIIYKQRLLILILLGCALIAAWVANEVTPPVYKAETKLLVQGDKSQLVLTELLPGSSPDRELANYTQILKSNAVLQKAAGSSKEAQLLKDSVTIQPETGSDLITISVEGEDPKWTAKMANNLVEAFSERLAEISRQQARSARIFIEEQLEHVKNDLADSEEKLKAYKEQNQILEPQGEIAQAVEQSARIKAQLEEARLASLEAERQIASLSGALSTREKEI